MSAKAASWTFDRGDRVGHLESHPNGEAAVQRRNDGWYWRAVYSGDGVQRTGLEKARQAAQNAAEAALCIPPAEPALSLADPTETLALIAEYRLRLTPTTNSGGFAWIADIPLGAYSSEGATIADAVRACVSRIRGQQ